MKKRFLILSNITLAGILTLMGCSKKVISDPIEQPEEPQKVEPDEPLPLLYGPPPVRYDEPIPADTNKNGKNREPRMRPVEPEVKPLYGVPPARFEKIEEK